MCFQKMSLHVVIHMCSVADSFIVSSVQTQNHLETIQNCQPIHIETTTNKRDPVFVNHQDLIINCISKFSTIPFIPPPSRSHSIKKGSML